MSIGTSGTVFGEAVFSTSMTGYQEMLTDPSFCGQLLTFTYPLIGNYGITELDGESNQVQVAGLIVREMAEIPSNWRSKGTLRQYLEANNVVGIQGVDTRSLTKHLRTQGVMMGGISTELSASELLEKVRSVPAYETYDYVQQCSVQKPELWTLGAGDDPVRAKWLSGRSRQKKRVALLDLGVKHNILRSLAALNVEVTTWPCKTAPEQILESDPDGIMVSPGPGDPSRLGYLMGTVHTLAESGKPMASICLGHQLLAYAYGGYSYKLPFGHRGGNHPVKDLQTGRVSITSQNHGYAVLPETLEGTALEVTHISMNDGTVEGLRHKELPVFSVQYHPEASPGPRDSTYLFEQFADSLEK